MQKTRNASNGFGFYRRSEKIIYGAALTLIAGNLIYGGHRFLTNGGIDAPGGIGALYQATLPLLAMLCILHLLHRNMRKRALLVELAAAVQSLCNTVLTAEDHPPFPALSGDSLRPENYHRILNSIKRSGEIHRALLQYKEQIIQERDFYTHILNETPSLVIWLNPNGTIKYCNPALSRSTGYSMQELLGKKWWDVFYHNGKRDPEIANLNRISSNGRRCIRDHVMAMPAKDGTLRYISWTTANIFDEDGDPVELIGLGNDITNERKRATLQAEEQKMKALAAMSGGLAHEIRNALQPILGLSEICAMQAAAGKDRKLEECMNIIQRNALHCRNIVNGVLSFARRDVKKKEIYNLPEILTETLEFTDEFLPPDIHVKCKGFGGEETDGSHLELMRAAINRTEMVQIMANLFTNASHAMQRCGTIEVGLSMAAFADTAAAPDNLPSGEYAVVSVRDTGYGMTEEVQKSLFQPFFTTKTVGEGTGLRLAAVYGILKDWGGAITVQSKPGEGSTFFLYIPLAGAPDHETMKIVEQQLHRGEGDENSQYTRH